jgi:hypothetical protein
LEILTALVQCCTCTNSLLVSRFAKVENPAASVNDMRGSDDVDRERRVVNPKNETLRLTKIQAATRQTDAAIKAFERGDFDIAITLAGAGEGMVARAERHFFRALMDSPSVRHVGKKNWIASLNFERDWLKHASGPRVLQLERGDAAFMITRAASKLANWSPQMKEFKKWLAGNIDSV